MTANSARGERAGALRKATWWAADYLYAARRQLAILAPPWTIGRARPIPPAWREGRDDLPEIVLLPGVYEHWTFLRPLAHALSAAGHRILVVHGLGLNRSEIVRTAERLTAVLQQHTPRGAGRVVVAHSKGGLIGKHALVHSDATATGLRGLVAVATPFGGSRLASFFVVPSIRAFRPKDATIVALSRETSVNARIVSIFGPYDPHIPEGSTLDGATNVLVPMAGHFRILGDRRTHDAVRDAVAHLATKA
jgi:hypothetical protein